MVTSAFAPRADVRAAPAHVCFRPKADASIATRISAITLFSLARRAKALSLPFARGSNPRCVSRIRIAIIVDIRLGNAGAIGRRLALPATRKLIANQARVLEGPVIIPNRSGVERQRRSWRHDKPNKNCRADAGFQFAHSNPLSCQLLCMIEVPRMATELFSPTKLRFTHRIRGSITSAQPLLAGAHTSRLGLFGSGGRAGGRSPPLAVALAWRSRGWPA